MLKITEILENEMTVRLRLDGSLSQIYFTDLEEIFRRHTNDPDKTIVLDMKGVNFMNNESASRLLRLRDQRLRIINCSAFIETLLNMAAGQIAESPSPNDFYRQK